MFLGWEEKRVARAMAMKRPTLHSHIKDIFRKTRVHSRAEFSHKLIICYLQRQKGIAADSR